MTAAASELPTDDCQRPNDGTAEGKGSQWHTMMGKASIRPKRRVWRRLGPIPGVRRCKGWLIPKNTSKKKKENHIPEAQMTPDTSSGPILVITALPNPHHAFET